MNFMKTLSLITAASVVAISVAFFNPVKTDAATNGVTVDLSNTKQVIRGFGTSTAWKGALSDTDMNYLYKDMGLSILRLRIDPNKSWSDELSNAKKAEARGALVFATPWSPPASMKTNNNVVGGELKTSSYADYANYLKSYATYMSSNGAPLYAISLQNEPDWKCDYESCSWTSSQFLNFLKNYGSLVGSTKIMMPESCSFNFSLSDSVLNDPTASSYVSIIGGHLYGATIKNYDLAQAKGKEVWMTEYYENGQTISDSLKTAKQIHDCLTVANMSAYIWWWTNDDNMGFLNASHIPQKRGYVVGQFSKFVRPGYYRVDATQNPQANIYVTAYKGDGKTVIVAINQGSSAVAQSFTVKNGSISSFSSWTTAGSSNIAAGANYDVSNGTFTASLPAQSVTTFVGSTTSSSSSSSSSQSTNNSIKVQLYNGNTLTTTSTLSPNFRITNTGTTAISLADVKARYYFTINGDNALNFACDWSSVGSSNVTNSFGTVSASNEDHYLEIGFSSGAGSLAPGANLDVNTRIWKQDWSNFNQSDDYSFNSTATTFTDWVKVPGYVSGVLQWGSQP